MTGGGGYTGPTGIHIDIHDLVVNGFTQLVEDLPVQRFSCSWVHNGPGAFEADIPLSKASSELFNVGAREILVAYSAAFWNVIWHGYLTSMSIDSVGRTAKITGEGTFGRLRKRYIHSSNRIYRPETNGDADWLAGDIVADLVDWTQGLANGDLGIVWPANDYTNEARRVFCAVDRENIGDAIEEMAEKGLIDFELRPDTSPTALSVALFYIYDERGSDLSASINFSGANTMTLNCELVDDIDTYVTAFGSGDCDPFGTTVNANETVYGRLESEVVDVDSDLENEITKGANEFLRIHKQPNWRADLTFRMFNDDGLDWTAFDIGDLVTVTPYPNDMVSSFTARVMEKSISAENYNRPTGEPEVIVSVVLEERPAA